jgi:TolA-binding protein
MARKIFFLFFAFSPIFAQDAGTAINHGLDAFNERAFEKGLECLRDAQKSDPDPRQKAVAQLYEAKCLIGLGRNEEAERLLKNVRGEELAFNPSLFHEWEYTQGLIAVRKQHWDEAILFLEKALPAKNFALADWGEKTAQLLRFSYDNLAKDPRSTLEKQQSWIEKREALKTQGVFALAESASESSLFERALQAFKEEKFAESYEQMAHFLQQYPHSFLADQALYWQARSAEALGNADRKKQLYQELTTLYPSSPFAVESYFFTFGLQDYLQGNRAALKHLQKLPSLYPDTLITLKALYLLGLDSTRDRKSLEGRSITRKNLTEAIDRFQELETRYQRLSSHDRVPQDQKKEWAELNERAMLMRALLNFEIAQSAQGAKRSIYLEYAESIYIQLLQDLSAKSPLRDEAQYGLAMTLKNLGRLRDAEAALNAIIQRSASEYHIAKAHQQRGRLAQENKKPADAVKAFSLALEKGDQTLSIEEKLETMIEKSLALKDLGQEDLAMQQLSEVINYQAVSQLRLKAMYLRAQFYAEQAKPALAKRQLESLALKDGPWGQKAKEQLETEYGYH